MQDKKTCNQDQPSQTVPMTWFLEKPKHEETLGA